MYLLFITFAMPVTYAILHVAFSLFFKDKITPFTSKSLWSVGLIFFLSLLTNSLASVIQNEEIGNRILHAFGGGFTTFLVCFLAFRDAKIEVAKWKFFITSLLVVIAFGVVNEIAEFYLQHYFNFIMATTIEDTWLDLISNIVGALIAALIFTPFIKKKI